MSKKWINHNVKTCNCVTNWRQLSVGTNWPAERLLKKRKDDCTGVLQNLHTEWSNENRVFLILIRNVSIVVYLETLKCDIYSISLSNCLHANSELNTVHIYFLSIREILLSVNRCISTRRHGQRTQKLKRSTGEYNTNREVVHMTEKPKQPTNSEEYRNS